MALEVLDVLRLLPPVGGRTLRRRRLALLPVLNELGLLPPLLVLPGLVVLARPRRTPGSGGSGGVLGPLLDVLGLLPPVVLVPVGALLLFLRSCRALLSLSGETRPLRLGAPVAPLRTVLVVVLDHLGSLPPFHVRHLLLVPLLALLLFLGAHALFGSTRVRLLLVGRLPALTPLLPVVSVLLLLPPVVLVPVLTLLLLQLGGGALVARPVDARFLVQRVPLLTVVTLTPEVLAVRLLLPPLLVLRVLLLSELQRVGRQTLVTEVETGGVALPPVAVPVVLLTVQLLRYGALLNVAFSRGIPALHNTAGTVRLVPLLATLQLIRRGRVLCSLTLQPSLLRGCLPPRPVQLVLLPVLNVGLLLPPLVVLRCLPVLLVLVGLPPVVAFVVLLTHRLLSIRGGLLTTLDNGCPLLPLRLVPLPVPPVRVLLPPLTVLVVVGVVETGRVVGELFEGSRDGVPGLVVHRVCRVEVLPVLSHSLLRVLHGLLLLFPLLLTLVALGRTQFVTVLLRLLLLLNTLLVLLLELFEERDRVTSGASLDLLLQFVNIFVALLLRPPRTPLQPCEDRLGVLALGKHVEHLRQRFDGHVLEEVQRLVISEVTFLLQLQKNVLDGLTKISELVPSLEVPPPLGVCPHVFPLISACRHC
eukprot:Hpha_TRINITY_DN15322_c2_g6::TRINITY_DN15322_c2_g6_i2::g.91526::m.91526